jgi:hypothetical protein
MRHPDKARGVGAVLRVAFVLAARTQAGDGGAVVVTVAVEDLVLPAAVALVRDLPDHLEGLLVGLRSGVAVIDPAETRHLPDQFLGEKRPGYGACRAGKVVHPHQLVVDGLRDAFAAVAHVDRPDAAGNRIEVFLAGLVPDPHAAALDDDVGVLRLEGLVLDQVMPDMGLVGLDNRLDIIGLNGQVHARSLPGKW